LERTGIAAVSERTIVPEGKRRVREGSVSGKEGGEKRAENAIGGHDE